jgi:hypothetical protein
MRRSPRWFPAEDYWSLSALTGGDSRESLRQFDPTADLLPIRSKQLALDYLHVAPLVGNANLRKGLAKRGVKLLILTGLYESTCNTPKPFEQRNPRVQIDKRTMHQLRFSNSGGSRHGHCPIEFLCA